MQGQVKTNFFSPLLPGLRLFYFISSIGILGGLIIYTFALPLLLLGRVFKSCDVLGYKVIRFAVFVLLKFQFWLNSDINISAPKSSEMGCLFISNHRSHLDAFFILSKITGIHIMAKRVLFYVPFLGIIMWAMRQIPVKGKNQAAFLQSMELARRRLSNGEFVHIFPEMTRCRLGFEGLQPFVLMPFQIAIQTGAPLIPIIFKNTDLVWPKSSMGLNAGIRIVGRSLDPIDSKLFNSAQELRDHVQQVMLKAL